MSSQLTQSKTIRAQLLASMKNGEYASSERLPRESVLSERLGISRTQLRDILAWNGRALSPAATAWAPSSTAMY